MMVDTKTEREHWRSRVKQPQRERFDGRSGPPAHRYAEHGPAGLPDVLRGVGLRLRWRRLAERHDERLPLGALALFNGTVSIGLMALAARLTHQPLVFPSLGPTAFLLFYRPHAEASCPRNALVGHLIGALAGLASLTAFGLLNQGPALNHVSNARIGAAALSLGLTAGCMIWVGTPHPPAGATTLIVSLGFLHTLGAVAVLMGGVALLVAQGLAVNRWAGIDYPIWAPHAPTLNKLNGAGPPPGGLSPGGDLPMLYTVFVDAVGDTPATEATYELLRAALAEEARELNCGPHEWTGMLTIEASDVDQAADLVRRRVAAADEAAGLPGWHFNCWEVRETLVRLDDEGPHWHPRLPHWHRNGTPRVKSVVRRGNRGGPEPRIPRRGA